MSYLVEWDPARGPSNVTVWRVNDLDRAVDMAHNLVAGENQRDGGKGTWWFSVKVTHEDSKTVLYLQRSPAYIGKVWVSSVRKFMRKGDYAAMRRRQAAMEKKR